MLDLPEIFVMVLANPKRLPGTEPKPPILDLLAESVLLGSAFADGRLGPCSRPLKVGQTLFLDALIRRAWTHSCSGRWLHKLEVR